MGLLGFVQGMLFTILLLPWLQLAVFHWDFSLRQGALWVLLMSLLAFFLVKRGSGQGKNGFPLILGALLIPPFVAWFLGFPLPIFIPLTCLLFFGAVRFNNYPKRASFATDWGLGSLALVICSSMEGIFGFEIGLGSMLSFFSLGIVGVIFWNATEFEERGLLPDYGGLGRSVTLFVLGVAALSLILGFLLSPSFLGMVLSYIQRIYLGLVEALMFFVIRPLAWLLNPLFEWASQVEKQEVRMELPEMGRERIEMDSLESPLSQTAVQTATWVSWGILVALIVLVTWLVVRKVLRRKNQEQARLKGDVRESIFDASEVMRDLQGILYAFGKPWSKLRQRRLYKGEDPLLTIRTLYIRFVLKANKRVTYEKGSTPLEYAKKCEVEREDLDSEAVRILTSFYIRARYGEQADQESKNAAKKAFSQIW